MKFVISFVTYSDFDVSFQRYTWIFNLVTDFYENNMFKYRGYHSSAHWNHFNLRECFVKQ